MEKMINGSPLWEHLLIILALFGMSYWGFRSSKQRPSYALEERTYMLAESQRLRRRFLGWMALAMGLFEIYLLWSGRR